MRRAEPLWQGLILFLVFLMTVGVYIILGLAVRRLREAQQAASLTPLPQLNDVVQIVEPLPSVVLQQARSIPIRGVIVDPGYLRAELQVDGVIVGAQANIQQETSPWVIEWAWTEATEGQHVLAIQAQAEEGMVAVSSPVTVTVVPTGQLAFASNRDGVYAVYTMETDGGSVKRLTGGPGDARQPAWSREGLLAFVGETGSLGEMIRVMDKSTGSERDAIAGREPAWSPDGTRLAYAASQDGVQQVFVLEPGSGLVYQVTAEEVYAGQPSWSPDGKQLAYVAERDGNWDIWTVALEGGEPRRLTQNLAMDWSPAWSPDSLHLAFVSNRGGSHQIHVMFADGSQVHPLTELPQGAESPSWSPDGFWLAFVTYVGAGVDAREIYLMRVDGKHQVRLTHNPFDDTEPDWAWVP